MQNPHRSCRVQNFPTVTRLPSNSNRHDSPTRKDAYRSLPSPQITPVTKSVNLNHRETGVSACKHLVANPARVRVIFPNSEMCWECRQQRRLRFPTTPTHGDDSQDHVLAGHRLRRGIMIPLAFLHFHETSVIFKRVLLPRRFCSFRSNTFRKTNRGIAYFREIWWIINKNRC